MNFTVVWDEDAEETLCRLWLAAPNPNDITRIANAIESELRRDPDSVGEARDKGMRVVMHPPIGMTFRIFPEDRLVKVVDVGWLPSGH